MKIVFMKIGIVPIIASVIGNSRLVGNFVVTIDVGILGLQLWQIIKQIIRNVVLYNKVAIFLNYVCFMFVINGNIKTLAV